MRYCVNSRLGNSRIPIYVTLDLDGFILKQCIIITFRERETFNGMPYAYRNTMQPYIVVQQVLETVQPLYSRAAWIYNNNCAT